MDKPNVFVLSVDSLRYDYFSEAQSRIADLINCTEFTNAVSTATQTSSSMPSLATGHYTDEISTWGLPKSGSPRPLAEVLYEQDYNTGLWTDNFLFGAEYNYDRGFTGGNLGKPSWKKQLVKEIRSTPLSDMFNTVEWTYFNLFKPIASTLPSHEDYFYKTASELNGSALKWLDSTTSPQFCWLHYMDTHHPFEPPTEYLEQATFNKNRSRGSIGQLSRDVIKANGKNYSQDVIEDVRTAYNACCEYIGDELYRFITQLSDNGYFDPDNDMLIITADHGEVLSPVQYRMMGHVPPAYWEEAVRVPLMISRPDWKSETVTGQVSLISLMDTVIDGVTVNDSVQKPESSYTPEDLVCENAFFSTEWENPDEGGDVTVYRGVRNNKGWKLFGGYIDERNKIAMTKYNQQTFSDGIIFEKDRNENKMPDKNLEEYEILSSSLRKNLVEYQDPLQNDLDKDHLRDLGYIE